LLNVAGNCEVGYLHMNLLTSRLYISVGYYLRIFAFYVQ